MQDISQEKRGTRPKRFLSIKYLKNVVEMLAPILSDPYWIHFIYFVAISLVGLIPLRLSPTKGKRYLNVLDAFYTSVSAATVSSLGFVAMEDLSYFHLAVMIILMLLGADVFTSSCSLLLARLRLRLKLHHSNLHHHSMNSTQMIGLHQYQITSDHGKSIKHFDHYLHAKNQIRRESIVSPNKAIVGSKDIIGDDLEQREIKDSREKAAERNVTSDAENVVDGDLEYEALSFLGYLCLGYFLFVQLAGITLVYIYFCVSKSGDRILNNRGVSKSMFAMFIVVSSFANCGFTPLNDNMMPLRKHSVLLMILVFQILMGNTTFGGFLTIEVVMLFALHWNTLAMDWLTAGEKVIGGVFQSVAIRHAGENIVNPRLLNPALLIVYIVFMYVLFSSTCYLADPVLLVGEDIMNKKWLSKEESIMFICITERHNFSQVPLNFNVLAIIFEVVSAYGNVGISLGYSCVLFNKMSKDHWKEVSYSFSGKWSTKEKLIIIMVMFLGRLKEKFKGFLGLLDAMT
ncbi:cation transporter HKT1;3-like [Cryptomeria japonica]|uniref:cation transporter HKT1;3-like n=1 Tax=Cryptomeria japonica TaxID=3369 RepID=UPI0025AD2EE8|nr:cation transporter HKT1;3-like [Cryptomeria japonica]